MFDENIIDARRRFASKDDRERAGQAARAESLGQTRHRLDEADRIKDQLGNARHRVSKDDRPRLARNLGRMIEAKTSGSPLAFVNQLFEMTFKKEAESALKKRKRYVRLAKDELQPNANSFGPYHAGGKQFVELAENLAKFTEGESSFTDDVRRRAILNLVEGTSYDTRARLALRRLDDSCQEFAERMADVLRQIERSVDLDWYFDKICGLKFQATRDGWSESDSQFLRVSQARWKDLRLDQRRVYEKGSIGPIAEDGDSLAEVDWEVHFLAPHILLGLIYTRNQVGCIPYKLKPAPPEPECDDDMVAGLIARYGLENLSLIEKAVSDFRAKMAAIDNEDCSSPDNEERLNVEVDLEEELYHRLGVELGLSKIPRLFHDVEQPRRVDLHAERIRRAIIEQHGPDAAIIFDDDVDSEDALERWKSVAHKFQKRAVWYGQALYLAIYRERATGRSRLGVIVIPIGEGGSSFSYDRMIDRFRSGKWDDSYAAKELDLGHPLTLGHLEDSNGNGFLVADTYGYNRLWDECSSHTDQFMFFPSSDSIDLAFMPVTSQPSEEDRLPVFRPMFDDCPGEYSPATPNTIAGAILRNLAHAPEGKRIFDVLLNDAQRKDKAVRDVLECEEDRYRRGIERLKS